MQTDFCYRIEKEASMAYEGEDKTPCEAYARLTLKSDRLPDVVEFVYLHEQGRKIIHDKTGIALEHITLITYAEYMRETEEETEGTEIGWN